MKDYSELKMLAESVGEAGYHWGRRDWAVRQLERSCNHETILDIIAELEILKYDCKVANSCVNAEKKESKRIRDENESLKKDAARYRWLRDESIDPGSVIDKKIGHSYVGDYPIYEYRAGQELDDAIDAEMIEVNNK